MMKRGSALKSDRSQMYSSRMSKFIQKIKIYQSKQVKSIQQKAHDEIQFQRNKIVSQARRYDNDSFNKKNKNFDVQYKIKRSRKINQSRLSKMKIRFQKIQTIQNQIKNKLNIIIQNKNQYSKLLQKLIIQGLIKLLQEKVQVKCLTRDISLIKSILPSCQQKFSDMCDVKTQLLLSREQLPQTEIGGIILTSFVGKIVCSNTLKVRLDYAVQQALPEIRRNLFTTELLSSQPTMNGKSSQKHSQKHSQSQERTTKPTIVSKESIPSQKLSASKGH